jgi:two-component system phosphate regulon sensor histidine kinase PhoR
MAESSGSVAAAWFIIARVVGCVVVGALLGLLTGSVWAGIVVALSVYLALQLLRLHQLDHWLRNRSRIDPPDANGLWGDVVALVVRLHRRKKYHKQRLIETFRELRRSTASMPDGVVTLNAENEIIWMNRMAGELLGLRPRGDAGLRIGNLIRHPEFQRYLAAEQHSQPVVIQPVTAVDQWLAMQLVPYGDGQKLLFVRDVTRQNRLETMRRDFVANASHELRSPLTVISGYLETLASDPGIDPELAPPLREMRRQAERMTAIVNDLLVLSRLEADEAEVGGAPVDVAAMLAMLRKDAEARPQRPGEVTLSVETPLQLIGDEGQLQSAFGNLVDNAIKYTPAGGRIALRWWADDDGGHVSVTDTGIGIAAEHLPRLTERFYRVDAGRARATGGSGLGLAIVKHALQNHGATLAVDSVEGRGSTFTCTFPPRRLAGPVEQRIRA